MKFAFNWKYFVLAIILFVVEVYIALYVHDAIIRPYVGDVLVVILIYCFIKSFFNTHSFPTAIGVLIFAFLVELLQFLDIVNVLGLQDSGVARTVIGTSFEWIDLIAYTLGFFIIIGVEKIRDSGKI